jgi:hypothetical protein
VQRLASQHFHHCLSPPTSAQARLIAHGLGDSLGLALTLEHHAQLVVQLYGIRPTPECRPIATESPQPGTARGRELSARVADKAALRLGQCDVLALVALPRIKDLEATDKFAPPDYPLWGGRNVVPCVPGLAALFEMPGVHERLLGCRRPRVMFTVPKSW